MKITTVVQLLVSRQLRPRRTYDGEYVASRCGRFLLKIGGSGVGAMADPSGTILSTDRRLCDMAVGAGYRAYHVPDFSKKSMTELKGMGGHAGRAALWLLGGRVEPEEVQTPGLRGWEAAPTFRVGRAQVARREE